MSTDTAVKDWVYFIQSEAGGPWKIGTTTNIDARMRTFHTGHPENLVVRRLEPGGKDVEEALHDRFAWYRISPGKEWFRDCPAIRDYVRTGGDHRSVSMRADAWLRTVGVRMGWFVVVPRGLWRLLVAVVFWVFWPAARKRRRVKARAALVTGTAGASILAYAHLPEVQAVPLIALAIVGAVAWAGWKS